MKRQVPHSQYLEMAQTWAFELQRMEEEIREYLLRAPPLEPVAG